MFFSDSLIDFTFNSSLIESLIETGSLIDLLIGHFNDYLTGEFHV